jgi:hypothetical protein
LCASQRCTRSRLHLRQCVLVLAAPHVRRGEYAVDLEPAVLIDSMSLRRDPEAGKGTPNRIGHAVLAQLHFRHAGMRPQHRKDETCVAGSSFNAGEPCKGVVQLSAMKGDIRQRALADQHLVGVAKSGAEHDRFAQTTFGVAPSPEDERRQLSHRQCPEQCLLVVDFKGEQTRALGVVERQLPPTEQRNQIGEHRIRTAQLRTRS